MERVVTRAIIADEENKVLLGLRAKGAGANQWAIIGGKPDSGDESMYSTIIREVFEETGLEFKPEFWKEIIDPTDPINPWRVFIFRGEASGVIVLKKDEILEIKYFTIYELNDIDIAFNHREILNDYFREQ